MATTRSDASAGPDGPRAADLAAFDVGAMVRLVAAVRGLALTCSSVEAFAQQVSELLWARFWSAGGSQTALVRFYGTTRADRLPSPEQDYLRAHAGPDWAPETTCLALLGTAGTLPEWNDRLRSRDHRVLPLVDAEQIASMPMIAALLQQLGVDGAALASGEPDVLLKSTDGTCRIFYVAQAAGSALVPAQDFVRDHGIRSTVGFGGSLPTGEVFAVVMFCGVDVPLESAELFETVALAIRLAALDMLGLPLFEGQPVVRSALTADALLQARVELSHALLEAHERIAAEQADQVQVALREARFEALRATGMARVALRLTGISSVNEVSEVLVSQGLAAVHADGLSVALVDEDGRHVDVTVSSGFSDRVAAAYARLPLDDRLPTTLSARTGQVVVVEDIVEGEHAFPDLIGVAHDSGVRAVAALPMWVGDRLMGALTCTWDRPVSIEQAGLELIQALAAQAAQAIDRWKLIERERAASSTLQRSLLTEPPVLPHADIAVRYVPAVDIAQVGGDWFDAFAQGQDTVLVIGDVVGHDTAAAAAMGQVRGLVRSLAWHTAGDPADVLCDVDAAMQSLVSDTTATCVVARLEGGRSEKERARLRWSNAGHPPPLLITADGQVTVLADSGHDLLLGVDPRTLRTEQVVDLVVGSTVLLFTDGLVERRGQDLDDGIAHLARVAGAFAGAPVQQLCDAVLEQVLLGAEDDVALLALRVGRRRAGAEPGSGPEPGC